MNNIGNWIKFVNAMSMEIAWKDHTQKDHGVISEADVKDQQHSLQYAHPFTAYSYKEDTKADLRQ